MAIERQDILEQEIRLGYVISAEMKAVWKVILDIVEEIVRICDKHGLRYSLAGGNLLGAIRHKGFIPWDDDFDIDMEREDYDRFLAVAEKELKYPLVLQTPLTDPERCFGFAQIRNCETTAIETVWVENKWRFNMGIGVDIFPIDGVPEEGSKEYRRLKRAYRFTQGVMNWRFSRTAHGCRSVLKHLAAMALYGIIGGRRLFLMRERAFARNRIRDCEMCGEISYRFEKTDAMWPSKCYESYREVPYEYLSLKMLGGYDEYLTAMYGDWRTPRQGAGFHGETLLDAKTPYKRVLVEKYGYKKAWLKNLPGSF